MRTLTRFLAAVAFAVPASAHAAPVPVTNFSFELDPAAAGTFPTPIPQGWSIFRPDIIDQAIHDFVGVINPSGTTFFTPDSVPHGSNAALVYLEGFRFGETVAEAGLVQTLGATLQPNTSYTLNVAVGNIASGTGLGTSASFGFANLEGFPGYRVDLLAGNTVIASDANSLNIAEGSFAESLVQASIGASHAALGQPLGIRLVNLNVVVNPAARGNEVDFDNVRLSAVAVPAVPEPEAYLLYLAGLGVIFARLKGRLRVQRGKTIRPC